MKNISFLLIMISGLFFSTIKAQTEMDTLSYSLGLMMSQQLKAQGLTEFDAAALAKGLEDGVSGNEPAVPPAVAQKMVQDHLMALKSKQHEGTINEGKKFLEENGARDGVVTLESGLQYEILQKGDGPIPEKNNKVSVHYHGTLTDGTVFDSSVDRGTPAQFGVTQVIPGWVEALQLMPTGSKWRLVIPYNLAYGERGAGGKIGPYSTLVFDVELLEIVE